MEDMIVYVVVAVVVIGNIIRNYQKEQKKNKERVIAQQQTPADDEFELTLPPFQRQHSEPEGEVQQYNRPTIESTIDYPSLRNAYTNLERNLHTEEEKKPQITARSEESIAFDIEINEKSVSSDLMLETTDDLNRAFIHSLIFDRKY